MKSAKRKKIKKASYEVRSGDVVMVGDHLCVVRKVEFIFYHRPKSRVRLDLAIDGKRGRYWQIVLILPIESDITVLK